MKLLSTAVDEKNAIELARENQLISAKKLFEKADEITENTPQKDICNLLSLTSEYYYFNTYFISEVQNLHKLLSKYLQCKYNGNNDGFNNLKNYIKTTKPKLH